MDTLVSIFIGIGLSAACGFRVFLPLLFVNLAGRTDLLDLGQGFGWLTGDAALAAFAMAAVLEILGYTIPWLDNVLDSIATPAAVAAGTVVAAAAVTDMDPFLQWSLAVIAGGGVAGTVQLSTVTARGISSATSGGLGNPAVSTLEAGGSVASVGMALFLPYLVPVFVLLLLFVAFRWILRRRVPRRL